MRHETAIANESRLRFLDRWVVLAILAITLVPLVPYALTGAAS
ncbi:hypothetical protein [Rubrivivax gelatinosus]|jgi:hypothetical protein|nr:hypothetical protein [Rubrivivax gelatinosus]